MDNRTKWIKARTRLGWMALAAGILVALTGVLIQMQFAYLPYNFRIITGLGILLVGIGVGYLVHYGRALKDEQSARRLNIEERDERTLLIRARAGNRAYWVSTGLVYLGLMWSSFAATGGLPDLAGNTLWFFLAGAVVIPFGVYISSILVDQRNS